MSSQSLADETTIRLEYNNGLGRDATADEVKSLIDGKITVEGVQRLVQNSEEHMQFLKDQQLGYKIRTEGTPADNYTKVLQAGTDLYTKNA